MKKIIHPTVFLLTLLLSFAAHVQAQEGFPPPAQNPALTPMQPQFPMPGAGPGLGYGQYGPQGYGAGQGYGQYPYQGYGPGMGYGRQGGRNYTGALPEDYRGYYRSGPGVMMGQGMTQFGMGPGMIRGLGVMGYIPSESFQKFFAETRALRKELNGLMFDYAELLREPKQEPEKRIKLENQIMALRQKVYDKAPRYQYPFE